MFTQVPLGVLLKSEIKHEDMVDIMEHYQNYVPTKSSEAEYHDPDSDDIVKLHIDHFHYINPCSNLSSIVIFFCFFRLFLFSIIIFV